MPTFYTTWNSDHHSFRQEEWLVANDPLYLKFWANITLFLQKRRFSIDLRSASAVTSNEKV